MKKEIYILKQKFSYYFKSGNILFVTATVNIRLKSAKRRYNGSRLATLNVPEYFGAPVYYKER